MTKAKPKKKPRRVVLGVGHPWFSGRLTIIQLLEGDRFYCSPLELSISDLGAYNKIRLVAEVLK